MTEKSTATMIRYLSRSNVENLGISGASLANAIEQTLRAAAAGNAENIPKSGIQLGDGRLFQSIMAVGTGPPALPYAATKVVGLAPLNHSKGLPHIGSMIVLLDGVTGLPCCLMEGSWITEMRTAAMSLVVARRLASPKAQRIGFIACGAQARAHLAVLSEEFPLTSVVAYSRRIESAEKFAAVARSNGFDVVVTDQPKHAVQDQDIIVSSVPDGSDPLAFAHSAWLQPGSFAALVDLGRSWHGQGFEAVEHRIVDDFLQAEKSQQTRRFTPPGPYTNDLKSLVMTEAPVRISERERGLFVFQGLALADLAAAALVYEQSVTAETGTLLPR